jgi:hypothetical protein
MANRIFGPQWGVMDWARDVTSPYAGNYIENYTPNTTSKGVQSALTSIQNNQKYIPEASTLDSIFQGAKDLGGDILETLGKTFSGATNTLGNFANWVPFTDQAHELHPLDSFIQGFNDPQNSWSGRIQAGALNATQAIGTGQNGMPEFFAGYENPSSALSARQAFNNIVTAGHDIPFVSGVGGFVTGASTDLSNVLPFPVKIGAGSTKKAIQAAMDEIKMTPGVELGSEAAQNIINKHIANANNQLLGLDLPFGPEIKIANKPDFMTKKAQQIGQVPAEDLANQMAKLGLTNEQRYQFLSNMTGRSINSTKDLNTQEFDYILRQLDGGLDNTIKSSLDNLNQGDPFGSGLKITDRQSVTDQLLTNRQNLNQVIGTALDLPTRNNGKDYIAWLDRNLPKAGLDVPIEELKQLNLAELKSLTNQVIPHVISDLEPFAQRNLGLDALNQKIGSPLTKAEGLTKAKSLLNAGADIKFGKQPKGTKLSANDVLGSVGRQAGKDLKVIDGLDGVSKLGKAVKGNKFVEGAGKLLGSRRYVPLSSKLADHRIEKGVAEVLNSGNRGFANAKEKINELLTMAKTDPAIKGLSKDELHLVPYVIEDAFPKSMPKESIPAEKLAKAEAAAEKFKSYLDGIRGLEKQYGISYKERPNYFPHVMNIKKEGFNQLVDMLRSKGLDKIAGKLQHSMGGYTKERTGFNTMAELRDFLDDPNVADEIKKAFEKAAFNPIEAYGKTAISRMRDINREHMLRNLADMGLAKPANAVKEGKDGKPTSKKDRVPTGWREVTLGNKDILVPHEIAKEVNHVDRLLQSSEEMDKTLEKMDKMYSIWRRNVTVVRAGFHIRQVIGNTFQNTLAGVTPDAYTKAASLLKKNNHSDQMYKDALEAGVIHTGSAAADLASTLDAELSSKVGGNKLQMANPLSESFLPGQLGRKAGEYEDNIARLAHFVHMREAGMSVEQAADSVRKYLFNYSEINNFGRLARVVLPFYQWMRNNIPFQIINAAKNPGKYAMIGELQKESQDEPNVDQALKDLGINNKKDQALIKDLVKQNGGVLPDFIQEGYTKVPGTDHQYFNVGLPSSDLNKLFDPIGTVSQSLNPALKLVQEIPQNRNTFGAPIASDLPDNTNALKSPEGWKYLLQQTMGGPGQLLTGDFAKGAGVNTYADDPVKDLERLIFAERDRTNAKTKEAKKQEKMKGAK